MAIPWHSATGRWWQRVWRLATIDGDAADPPRQAASTTNVAAFESFVGQYERLILNYLWRMTSDEASAYDLTQETFLRAWEHFTKIQGYQQPRAWLFRVATNLALSWRARRRGAVMLVMPLDALGDPAASDPARGVVEREVVRLTLQTLAPKPRALLILREVYGLSTAEIAEVLAMSPAAVKMALSRAREQFRRAYEQEARQQ